jgi:ABC-type polysaccharide/polyol phosphate transport system ATPase subunit
MSEALLSVRDLNLFLASPVYRPTSWREAFVHFIKRSPKANLEKVHVCRGISFDLYPGDRVALIGRNGAGKTSLCRCIAGFYRPTAGEIVKQGRVRALFDPAPVVQAELTGRENAWLLATLLYPTEDVMDLVEEALDFSELGSFLNFPVRTYSKGMQVRLGLSLSALKGADILILDEVFDGADFTFREKISARMVEVIEKSGSVLFISHSEEQIRRVCNRVLLLDQGALVFDGPVEEGLRLFHGRPLPETSFDEGPPI